MVYQGKIFHVVHTSRGWKVNAEDGSLEPTHHGTLVEAVALARELARAEPLSEIVVHGTDGAVEAQYRFGDGPRTSAHRRLEPPP